MRYCFGLSYERGFLQMHNMILVAFFCLFSPVLFAEALQLKALNFAVSAQGQSVSFDFSQPIHPQISKSSDRLNIKLDKTALATALKQPPMQYSLMGKIKAQDDKDGLLLSIEIKPHAVCKSFTDKNGTRLVVNLAYGKPAPVQGKEPVHLKQPAGELKESKSVHHRPVHNAPEGPREVVIAIDAGHGGKDTGAIGPNGTYEKDVVFQVAKKLEAYLKKEPGFKPVMVRNSDEFIDLRERSEVARKAKADLFVSLHADAYQNGDARGSSVFTLSLDGESSEAARWLADRENASDLVGGVNLRDKGRLLASVLLDLSQNATREDSNRAAARILKELQKNHRLHHQQVQKAGFAVLKSPDIPSLLVEMAFISNPDEEMSLRSQAHQELVARSVFNGIRAYCISRHHLAASENSNSTVLALH